MKTPYKSIYQILNQNRFIVWSLVISTTLTCIVAVLSVLKIHKDSVNNAFMVRADGEVIPLKLVSQKENLSVEMLSHLEQFHTYFYNLDASNYRRNLEKALWLGNSSIDAIYQQKKSEGVYNRLLQYSLVQRVVEVQSKVDLTTTPYSFWTTTRFEINRGSVVDSYELKTTGNLIHVDRNFPNNPHGLLITNFFEKSLKKLSHENRKK